MEHSGTTGGLAAHMRIVLRSRALPVLIYRSCPGLERHIGDLQIGGQVHARVVDAFRVGGKGRPGISLPNTLLSGHWTEGNPTVRQMWGWPRRRTVTSTSTPITRNAARV